MVCCFSERWVQRTQIFVGMNWYVKNKVRSTGILNVFSLFDSRGFGEKKFYKLKQRVYDQFHVL